MIRPAGNLYPDSKSRSDNVHILCTSMKARWLHSVVGRLFVRLYISFVVQYSWHLYRNGVRNALGHVVHMPFLCITYFFLFPVFPHVFMHAQFTEVPCVVLLDKVL